METVAEVQPGSIEHAQHVADLVGAPELVNFIKYAGRNYGKPNPCRDCGEFYKAPMDGFNGGQGMLGQYCAWEFCPNCGLRRVKRSHGVPVNYLDAQPSDFPEYNEVDWAGLMDRGQFITGPVGSGKTHFCYALFNEYLRLGEYRVKFVDFHTMTRSMRAAYKPPRYRSEEQLVEEYARPLVLFIDDVFGSKHEEKPSEDENHVLYEVVRERYVRRRKTYLTSNNTLERLQQLGFNPRTISRLRERCAELPMTGRDRRTTNATQDEIKPRTRTFGDPEWSHEGWNVPGPGPQEGTAPVEGGDQ